MARRSTKGYNMWRGIARAIAGRVEMPADFARAQRRAEDIIREFGITSPPIDPEAIAEALDVDVVYARFSSDVSDQISGYIEPARSRIVVNRDIKPNRKTYTIAHELGHYLLHKEYTKSDKYQVFPRMNQYSGQKPDEEREADAFAANLLVPEKFLREYKDYASTSELARMFCVSQEVILHRLKRI